ncbi:sphingosine kinase 1-like isoform X2 [Vigna umbellata]|uniref:sphingosine kinase 1-like isoform X2 n=1 Tax=Vigna umbellata TaxID=87088 RepID=UPI001F5FB9A2|nr:sphingosine kinase 1-like isoform X2 [Vigna umbellata]XP_052727289.1 sphingosine kinase 1 isoform X3 [Vigna angularis]
MDAVVAGAGEKWSETTSCFGHRRRNRTGSGAASLKNSSIPWDAPRGSLFLLILSGEGNLLPIFFEIMLNLFWKTHKSILLFKVVNGLLQREDWDTAIKIPLGVVPAGTGNGMAKSLLDSVGDPCTITNSVLAIIRGHKQSLDVATITQGETRFFSVLMLAWGLVADIDIESEKYRWMGSARIDFYALTRIFHLRHYEGCLYFVPAPGFEAYGETISYPGSSASKRIISDQMDGEPGKLKRLGYQGPEIDLENLSWRVLNGPFISVWLHNVPWGAENTKAAPNAEFSDGYLDLIIMKNCPKLPLLSLMSEMNNGGHVKSPHVMYLKVKALVLEPGPRLGDQEKEGIIDADGEVLARGKGSYHCEQKALMAYDKLQITVDQGLATLFTPI